MVNGSKCINRPCINILDMKLDNKFLEYFQNLSLVLNLFLTLLFSILSFLFFSLAINDIRAVHAQPICQKLDQRNNKKS